MQALAGQILHYAGDAWRYRWAGLAASWVICLGGWIGLAMFPDIYEASARVYVDTSSELSQLLDDQILDPNIQEALAYVRQSMLGSVQLEKVARETDLLLSARSGTDVQAIIANLADKITIEGSGGWRNIPDNTYTISYQDTRPTTALDVVRTVLDIFIEDTLAGQQSSSDVSRRFLLEQIEENEERLEQAEQRLADFNRDNFDRLPGQQGGYFERLQAEVQQLEATQQKLEQAASRRDHLHKQIRGELPRLDDSSVMDPNGIDARIQQFQIRLEELLLRFTEDYPDVVALRETIRRLQYQQESEPIDLQDQSSLALVVSDNPVYQSIQISLNETEAEIATLQADLHYREKRVQELRNVIDEITDVEAQSARLNRNYGVIQAQYQALINSLERQRLSREVLLSESVEFRVIDPPLVSPDPVVPVRIVIVPAILLLGIGAGIVGALLLSQLRPVIQGARSLQANTGRPVIGTVYFHAIASETGIRIGSVVYTLGAVLLLGTFTIVFAIEGLGSGFRAML